MRPASDPGWPQVTGAPLFWRPSTSSTWKCQSFWKIRRKSCKNGENLAFKGHHRHFSNTSNVMQQNNKPFALREEAKRQQSDIFSASQLPQNTKATTARKIWMHIKCWGLAGKAGIVPRWLCPSLENAINPPCVILQLVGLIKTNKQSNKQKPHNTKPPQKNPKSPNQQLTTVHFLSGAWQRWAYINSQCLQVVAQGSLGLFPRCLAPNSSTTAGTLHG